VPADRLRLRAGNAVDPPPPGEPAPDVVYAGNFSIGELGDRTELLDYLRGVAGRLGPGGVFACDVYGGESAYMIGSAERPEPGPDGGTIVYTWEQREADPLTGRVVNALHFEVLDAEDASLGTMADAFVYRWRLWGVPELRDAMRDAGFRSTEVHARVPEAVDEADVAYVRPIEDPAELEDSFDVLIVGRLGP
jgi:hypothetical protein